ncbi:hypothetical protein [Winogradskyella undariae]|uniref:hypothetical protein n=1 Tax=Winogradskyella undariae TaxID=1285465 RepID=UPI0015C843C5|nr:hypothetical protein [Winogradskyella undariae]
MFWLKLKAGALQLTLFIAVVIALLLTAFILLVQTHKRFSVQNDFIIETIQNTNTGINHTLDNVLRLNDTISIDLKDEDYKSLKVHREFWGVFEKVISISKIKTNTIKKVALIGAVQPEKDRLALYLQDNNKPLVLVKNTKIKGLAYLPKRGVKPGNISGEYYYGSQLIYGESKISQNLPELNIPFTAIENAISNAKAEQFLETKDSKTYKNSFFEPTRFVFSNSKINLGNLSLIGNIIVQSKIKIVVDASCVLKDVILIAPEIEVQNNVKGNFQSIASKNIVIGEQVELSYPSALVLNRKQLLEANKTDLNEDQSKIIVNSSTIIKGVIVYLDPSTSDNFKVQLELKDKATLIGEIYCNKNLELRGTVFGSVITNNFIAKQSGSIYQNHIYNGTIIANELPLEYVGLLFKNSKKGVAKWLY